jgi:hypothetical protein
LRGRCCEEEERKEENGAPTGGVGRLEIRRERERERVEEAAVRAGPSWAARGKEEKENRVGAEWGGTREERWATGKEAGLRGRKGKQAGLGWELGLPSYFLPFFFSNHPKSILI